MAADLFKVFLEFSVTSKTEITNDVQAFTIQRELGGFRRPFGVGQASVTIENERGRYSPQNTDSDFSGLMLPGVTVDIETSSGDAFYCGAIDEWIVQMQRGEPRQAVLKMSDGARELIKRNINTSMQTNVPVNSAFTNVFLASSLETSQFSVQAIIDELPFVSFRNVTAASAINELADAGAYSTFVSKDNVIAVKDRYFEIGEPIVNSYTEFLNMTFGITDDNILNRIIVRGEPRIVSASVGTTAFLEAPLSIPASSHISFFTNYVDPENLEPIGAVGMVTPVSSQDWQTNTASDGGGTDRTAQTSLITTFFGETCVSTVFNGSPAQIFLNKFVVRGKPIRRASTLDLLFEDVDSSQAVFGIQEDTIESRLFTDTGPMENIGDYLLETQKELSADITFTLRNDTTQLTNELADKIHLTNSLEGIDAQYTIIGLVHEVEQTTRGFIHDTTYRTELARLGELLILNDATNGILNTNRLGRAVI